MQQPRLRFKRFNDDWKINKLGNTITFISGNDGQYTNIPILTISAKNRWMKQSDRFSKVIAGKELKRYTLLKRGELSYNHGNSKASKYGAVFELKEYSKALVPKVYHSFKVHSFMNAAFIDYLFTSKIPDRELRKLVSSGARMDGLLNINKHDFASILIRFPEKNEQTKIGEFFNHFDKLIELQSSKLEHLKSLKKGYLQNMFTSGDVPRLRFKGYSDEWKLKKLGDVAKIYDGTHQTPRYRNSGVQFVSAENIKNLSKQSKYISSEDYIKNYKDSMPQKGDVLMTRIGKIGIANIVCSNNPLAYYVTLALIKPIKTICPRYLLYVIQSDNVQRELWARTLQVAFPPKINKNEIPKVNIVIPSIQEQIKIGEILAKLDKIIKLQSSKLEHLKQDKKGYLQKMFI